MWGLQPGRAVMGDGVIRVLLGIKDCCDADDGEA